MSGEISASYLSYLAPSSLTLYLISLNMSFDEATPDYYAILGVPLDADKILIRKRYKQLALLLHPDKVEDQVKATKDFQMVNVPRSSSDAC